MFPLLHGALRRLRARKAWTTSAVATIALVVGAASVQFAALHGLLLKRYPFPNAERLVLLWERNNETGLSRLPLTESAYPVYRDRLASLATLGCFIPPLAGFPVRTPDGAPVALAVACPELFDVLGATPLLGRTFQPSDALLSAEEVVLLSHGYWQKHFAGRDDVVGASLELLLGGRRTRLRVLGVLPAEFRFPYPLYSPPPDLWRAARHAGGTFLGGHNFYTLGLLRPGMPASTLREVARELAREIARDEPRWYGGVTIDVEPIQDVATREAGAVVAVLATSLLIVVVIGGVNLLHLLLARAWETRHEFAVRAALGARPSHLLALTASEVALLLALGSAVAAPLGYGLLRLLPHLLPPGLHLPRAGELASDRAVIVAAALGWLAVGGALAMGVWAGAARQARALRLAAGFDPARWVSGRPGRAGPMLVAAEVALAVALTTVAVSVLSQVQRELRADADLQPEKLLVLDLFVPPDAVVAATAALQPLMTRLEAWPDVEHVALAASYPLSRLLVGATIRDGGLAGPDHDVPCELHVVSAAYLPISGTTLVSGRWFDRTDDPASRAVAVINRPLARRLFAGRDPIGQVIRIDRRDLGTDWSIVGVVDDTRRLGTAPETRPAIYISWGQRPLANVTIIVKTTQEARALARRVRDETLAALPGAADVKRATTGAEIIGEQLARSRFVSQQLLALAALALALALTGLHGVVARVTAWRTRELAIRVALGCTRAGVFRLVIGSILRPSLAGIAVGLLVGVGVERAVRGAVELGGAPSPWPYALVALLSAGLVVAAALPVAIRATRVEPAGLLREVG